MTYQPSADPTDAITGEWSASDGSGLASRRLVVAAVIVDDVVTPTRLLGARRVRPEELAGRWEFPGGKVDAGETPVGALHRELREELGVAVELGAELMGPDDGGWIITDRHVMRLWFARVTDGDPEPLVEHDELRWLDADGLFDVHWLDGDVRIVEALASHLDRDGG
ncbi:NUDIX hydrolase [Xylanimonas cellulosilytica DSM 15894]|uniref:8-oxo-dGTP diphosphatase n=1 Tax=Xylanimonas cellulosilytica (strain DSM 15894 / JCM 12276 / CECT 5975 / KCTC 9989 / LMG 20990 / NBRC 107835 / XIL07) TaxID=446471 RepID=D1BTE7_XYLCX|nr:(deoxy)nucleoside triphosphate pyrophosphohydrolase [Xylanimonas cellulosilytica]ACZ29089.1 NUDIX hydrolase [Xylanimonas cellulosilytica DSM 15894]